MFDLFIVIVFLWAIISGWRNGLLNELASLGGHLVGLVLACVVYSAFGTSLAVTGSRTEMVLNIVAFFILWIIVPIVLGFAASILTKFLRPLGLGFVNRIGGVALSIVKFTLLLACSLSAMTALGILDEQKAAESRLYTPLKSIVAEVIDWAIDDDIRAIQPADGPATTDGDTLWIDVPHNAEQPAKGIKADRAASTSPAKH